MHGPRAIRDVAGGAPWRSIQGAWRDESPEVSNDAHGGIHATSSGRSLGGGRLTLTLPGGGTVLNGTWPNKNGYSGGRTTEK